MAIISLRQKDGEYEYINTNLYTRRTRSAYDVAKANGFKGTEKQWLRSLKGKDGEYTFDNSYLDEINYNKLNSKDKTIFGSINEMINKLNKITPSYNLIINRDINGILKLTTDTYQCTDINNDTTIILPETPEDLTEIHLKFSTSSIPFNIFFNDNINWDCNFIIKNDRSYEFIFKYINNQWYAQCLEYKTLRY